MKVLKFQASWCQPCKMLSRVVEDAKDKITSPIEEIDIDENMELAKQYNVRGVPMLVVVDDTGNAIRTKSGYMNEKDLLEFVNG
jgi:thioredoxin 1